MTAEKLLAAVKEEYKAAGGTVNVEHYFDG